jgi:RNA polymerase sigma-70 factor, ECF subfamily
MGSLTLGLNASPSQELPSSGIEAAVLRTACMSVEPQQDRELVRRLKLRDPNAMLDLYDRYARLLYSIILRAVKNSSVAEDLTQEAFLRVWNRVGTFDEEKGNLQGWLVTVARNRAFDYLRSVRNAPDLSSPSLTDLERTGLFVVEEGRTDQLVAAEAVRNALSGLNREQREVIELTHFEGMTQTEIAGRLNKPLGTVKGLVRSALKSLRIAIYPARFKSADVSPGPMSPSQEVPNEL